MAEISKLQLGSTTYSLKDAEARLAIQTLQNAVASSLIFKGVVSSATGITSLTSYKIGWTYKASANFTISGLGKIESGDMIICISDYASAFKSSDWAVVQSNVDVMEGATITASGTSGLVPSPTAGDNENYLCGDGTWKPAGVEWGYF